MSAPFSESAPFTPFVDISDVTPDAAMPTTHYAGYHPIPAELLEQVTINADHHLHVSTALGDITVEMYRGDTDSPLQEQSGFLPALDTRAQDAPGIAPYATQRWPYVVLPNGAHYGPAVRAPLDVVFGPWSEPQALSANEVIGERQFIKTGMRLDDFKRHFPDIDVGDTPPGLYDITMLESTRPTLGVLARVEGGEPLWRRVYIAGDGSVHYYERPFMPFRPSELRPDTTVGLIDTRVTEGPRPDESRAQPLQFASYDGQQRSEAGADRTSGIVEIVVLEGEAVRHSEVRLKPYEMPRIELGNTNYNRYDDLGPAQYREPLLIETQTEAPDPSPSSLAPGETRYGAARTIQTSSQGVRNLRAIAAFRFVLRSQTP